MNASFLWIFIAMLVWGVVHSLLASLMTKDRVRRFFGEKVCRFYRLAYNLFSVLSLLPVLALALLLPDIRLYTIPMPWALLFLAVQSAAVMLLAVGVWQTGAWTFLGLEQLLRGASSVPPRLVTDGLYRWVRHPLYAAGMLVMIFTPVMTANLLALYVSFAAYLIVGATFEERKLLREFGPAYADYRRRTPMFVPGIRAFNTNVIAQHPCGTNGTNDTNKFGD